jgi:hypothetical protein
MKKIVAILFISLIFPNLVNSTEIKKLWENEGGTVIVQSPSEGKNISGQHIQQTEELRKNLESRLKTLNNLLKKGLITQEDYDRKKKELLSDKSD